ncbi:MAG TPA: hypothetical protein VIV40_44280, partial [Kofleriaceae bacterium]
MIAITSLASGSEVSVVTADRDGRFAARLDNGEYALAVTTEHGFGWVETVAVPKLDATVMVSRTCRMLTGKAKGAVAGTQATFARKSKFTGDIFVTDVRADGSFSACLPEGHYSAMLRGTALSLYASLDLTASGSTTHVEIDGIATTQITQPPP